MMKRKKGVIRIESQVISFALILILLITTVTNESLYAAEVEYLPIYVSTAINEFGTGNVGGDHATTLLWARGDAAATTNNNGDKVLRIVPDEASQSGTVVRRSKIKLKDGFSTYFVMNLNEGTSSPADGLTFIVQDNAEPVLGDVGGGVGYRNIPNSIGVEFDIWKNIGLDGGVQYYDPNANHIAIVADGVNTHANGTVSANTSIPTFNIHGEIIHVWIDYAESGLVTVTYGKNSNRGSVLNETFSSNAGTALLGKDVFVGFAASTGGSNANHDIIEWYFKDGYVDGGLDPEGNYQQGANSVDVVCSDTNPETASIRVKAGDNTDMLNEDVDVYIDGDFVETVNTGETGLIEYVIDYTDLEITDHTIKAVAASGGASGSDDFTYLVNTVQFESNGGTVVASTSAEIIIEEPETTKEGYTFEDWYKEESLINKVIFPYTVTGDITFYAKWLPIDYTITYDLVGGSLSGETTNPTTYTIEASSFTLENPIKEGYTFTGWTGSGLSQASTSVEISNGSTGNLTYTANWSLADYTITYDLGGGSLSGETTNPTTYTMEASSFTLENPIKEGYTFAGWTGSGLSQASTSVEISNGTTGNLTYTANWSPVDYTITYDLGGGSLSGETTNPTTYTIEASSFTLENPIKEGYTFTGWTGNGLSQASTSVEISNGSTGNLTYTANWSLADYTITYDLRGGSLS